MSTTKRNVFVVTKPLQILMSLSIIKQAHIERSATMVIVDAFANSRLVCESLSSLDWDFREVGFHFAQSVKAAHTLVRRSKGLKALYIMGDVGLRQYLSIGHIKLNSPTLTIHVYEEGHGTYKTDLYGGIKAKVFNIVGVGTHFGGCSFTDAIHVCDPEAYRSLFPSANTSVHAIDRGPGAMLHTFREELTHVFDYRAISSTASPLCNVYLTDWVIDHSFLEIFCALEGDNYIKPHPHIKSEPTAFACRTLSPTVPAEMFLLDAMAKYSKLVVYHHHGSSAERYIKGDNIVFKNVDLQR